MSEYTEEDIKNIAQTLGKATQVGEYWRCLCPCHDDHNPSLDLKIDNGKILYICRAGCSQSNLTIELKRRFPQIFTKKNSNNIVPLKSSKITKEEYAKILWQQGTHPANTQVENYLKKRIPTIDINKIPNCIKFAPNLKHALTKKYFPCLLASFTSFPSYTVDSLTRIYLNNDGSDKADVEPKKTILGVVNGRAIVIDKPTEQLIIAEGIESALSIREIVNGQIPVWSAVTAPNLGNIKLPPLPLASELIISCDYDEAGIKAAFKLATKAKKEGRIVQIIRPIAPYTDFNDAYLNALKNKSKISIKALTQKINEEEEAKRLDLKLLEETVEINDEQPNLLENSKSIFKGLDDDVAIAKNLFRRLQKDYGEVIYADGELWVYPKKATHWSKLSIEYLKKKIQAYSGQQNTSLKGKEEFIKLNNSRINSILEILYDLKILPTNEDAFFKDKNQLIGINCLNGFIKIDANGFQIIPHHKSHKQQFTVPFNFNPNLLKQHQINWDINPWNNSLIKKFLFGVFEGDYDFNEKIILTAQIFGVTASRISTKMKQPKAFFLIGEKANNGKSQFLFLLKSFLPENEVVSVDPEQFGDKHERVRLKNKSLNIAFDITGGGVESSEYKKLITGDWTSGRGLYQNR